MKRNEKQKLNTQKKTSIDRITLKPIKRKAVGSFSSDSSSLFLYTHAKKYNQRTTATDLSNSPFPNL